MLTWAMLRPELRHIAAFIVHGLDVVAAICGWGQLLFGDGLQSRLDIVAHVGAAATTNRREESAAKATQLGYSTLRTHPQT